MLELKGLNLATVKAIDFLYKLEKKFFYNEEIPNNNIFFRGIGIENLEEILNSDEVLLNLNNKIKWDNEKMFFSNDLLYPFTMPKLINKENFKGWLILCCNLSSYKLNARLSKANMPFDISNIFASKILYNPKECDEFFITENLKCKDILRMYAIEINDADNENYDTTIYVRENDKFVNLLKRC